MCSLVKGNIFPISQMPTKLWLVIGGSYQTLTIVYGIYSHEKVCVFVNVFKMHWSPQVGTWARDNESRFQEGAKHKYSYLRGALSNYYYRVSRGDLPHNGLTEILVDVTP